MTSIGRSLDLLISLVGTAAWGFAAFVIGHHFLSRPAAGVFALGLAFSMLALVLSSYLQEARMTHLSANVCPRCRRPVAAEHRHRRWAPERSSWLPPLTAWQCSDCGYTHNESWSCPSCPT